MLALSDIQVELQKNLSEYRYRHISSVVEAALAYAELYAEELSSEDAAKKIELAAWLHDLAKEFGAEEQLSLAKYYGIEIYPEDEAAPNLLHARNGAAMAEDKYDVYDPVVLAALREHTFGGEEMCLESKIVFLADMLEPLRDADLRERLENGEELNDAELAYTSKLESIRYLVNNKQIDEALLAAMNYKIERVLRKGNPIHPLGMKARNAVLANLAN